VKCREEGSPVEESESNLLYETSLGGVGMYAMYEFESDRLVRGAYFSREKHTNTTDYVQDYQLLKELLLKKYGKPTEDDVFWKNRLYKDDPSHWGVAISMGHLVYRAKWITERSLIYTMLYGENFEVNHSVVYEEKASSEEREQRHESAVLEQL
jgi:hypothetical protein